MRTLSQLISVTTALAMLISCQPVGITDQATLSRRLFQFQSTGTQTIECGLSNQLEPGRASSSNVGAGGCSSCH